MDDACAIQAAIANNENIVISYYGGSKPGAVRTIAPISLKNGKVRAKCFASGKIKVFILDKIKINPDQDIRPSWSSAPTYTSIKDLYEQIRQDLDDFGWHVAHKKQNDHEHVRLHRKFLDGVPLKSIEAEISYSKYAYNFDPLLDEPERIVVKRPYFVRGKNSESKSYKYLDKAAAYFIELSKRLDPTSKRKSKK